MFDIDASISKKLEQLPLLSIVPPSAEEDPELIFVPFNSTLIIPELFVVGDVIVQLAATGGAYVGSGAVAPLDATIDVFSKAALTLVFWLLVNKLVQLK